ncbi:uncharacterized protein LOC127242032 [Andrographis paniculata]|uniref:uncharacterized protein LOC127242032 n=1 Tax=Andrographis paniculata TaxID=175694 RepID=UPI0021E74536|nr:uncharacterized protein LOC127242032 [Andrographis paniculata]
MGNYASCTLPGPVSKSFVRATKVILPSGEVRRLHEPTKAAELMLDSPTFFLVDARSLRIGKRFAALSADDDLEIGAVYVFFPMKRLNAAATEADVAAILTAAAARRVSRVLPENEEELAAPEMDLDDLSALELKHRVSTCRSKKPLLETIVEEPLSFR